MQRWRATLCLLALVGCSVAASPLTVEDEALIARSRQLMLQASGTVSALSVADPAVPQVPFGAAPQVQEQGISATGTSTSQGTQWLLFASLSLGEGALKILLREAAAAQVTVLFRGIPEGMTLGQGIRHLHQLLADIDPLPSVTIDPVAFRRWGVTTVPQLLALEDDQLVARASGVSSRDWLQRRREAGAGGDLGTWGPVVSPTEPDLLETLQARVTGLDLATLKQEAIAGFWSRQRFSHLPVATQDQTHWLDPTVELQADLRDADGRVLVPVGTRINPLQQLPFRQAVVVFDARDSRQLERVQQWLDVHPATAVELDGGPVHTQAASAHPTASYNNQYLRITLVSTGIHPNDGWEGWAALEQRFARPVYLLNAALHSRFQLREVPAVIDAVGERFRVRYLAVTRNTQVQN